VDKVVGAGDGFIGFTEEEQVQVNAGTAVSSWVLKPKIVDCGVILQALNCQDASRYYTKLR
jgi:hypothetical protein